MKKRAYIAALSAAPLLLSACVDSEQNTDGPIVPVAPLLCVAQGEMVADERAILPSDAMMKVRVLDRAVLDGPAPPLGEATFEVGGRLPPLPFLVDLDCTIQARSVEPVVSVQVESGGRVIYANRENVFLRNDINFYRVTVSPVR